jgi:putative transcriptional regulator
MVDVFFAGSLLVASPALQDPNFTRTVILLLDHDDDGAFGVVLNRPSEMPAFEALPRWADAVSEPAVVHVGGPVTPEAVVCLGRVRPGGAPAGWTPLGPEVGAIDLEREPEEFDGVFEGVRLFAGYAGWGAGQLESELLSGGWLIVSAEPGDAFTPTPHRLWATVLRRQGGDLAMLHTLPDDPTMN